MPDDYSSDLQTSGAVEVGGSVTGDIEVGGDRDWFAVELEAGKTYRIDLEGSGAGALRDPYLRGVYDADGARLPGTRNDDGGAGNNSRVFFTATEDATYYVAAGAYRSWQGTYTLSVEEVVDDFAAGTGTDGAVEVGGSATGDIETPDDRDWFAVELEAGKTYRIDLEGLWTWAGSLHNPYLRGVHDADGVLLPGTTNDNGGAGSNSRVYFTATEDATYYVAAGAYGSRTDDYTLSVTEVPADDFAAWTGTSGAVEVGGSATGGIDYAGDRDWFAVELKAGKTYRIDLEGSGAGALRNPYLRGVHDADGDLLPGTRNDDGGAGSNSRVFFTPTEDATYYVAAGAYQSRTGAYTLSVTEVADDFAAGTGTAGAVEVGGSATGGIDYAGDRDWFAVELEAGTTYRIDLEGSGAGALSNPYLRGVHDADGDLLPGTTNDDGGAGRNSRVYFRATEDATHYVAAGAWGDGEGAYTLSVTEVADDFGAWTGTDGAVEIRGSVTGGIDYAGDRDWFAVELEAGTTYRIDLEGSGAGALSNPYLRGVHDANGDLLPGTRNDDGGAGRNSRVEFTATGGIDYAGDRDWFAVELEAGTTYRIDLEGYGAGALSDPYLRGVHDADGDLLPGTRNDDGGAGRNSRVYFRATEDATHYVAAGAYGDREGDYTLLVTDVTDDDFAAGTGTTGTVEVGGSVTGDIEVPGDRDWFAVELEVGKTYRIDLEGSGAGTLRDPHLRGVHDADGDLLPGTTNDDDGAGRNSRVFFTPTEDATYYVVAGAYQSATGAYQRDRGAYTLSVTEVTDAGTGTTGTVEVGGSVTGDIEVPGDRDWFAVSLLAGRTYRIDLEGSGAGALHDPYLYGVHDADGDLLPGTTNDDGGAGYNSRVEFTATEDATYYVAAGAYGSWRGDYTLSVEEVVDGI